MSRTATRALLHGNAKWRRMNAGHTHRDAQWVGVFVLIGLALRCFDIGAQSVWIDEAYTEQLINQSTGAFLKELFLTRDSHANQPLYYLLMHFYAQLFGVSETALRIPSALFGTVAIPFFYWSLLRLEGRDAAMLGTTLFSVSSFLVWYAQEARPYSLLLLISCIAFWAYVCFMQEGRLWQLWVLVAAEVFGVYGSALCIGLLAAFNLHALAFRRDFFWSRRWLVSQAVCAGFAIPFFLFNVLKATSGAHAQFHGNPLFAVAYASWSFLHGFSIGPASAELHIQKSVAAFSPHAIEVLAVAVVYLALAAAIALKLWRSRHWGLYVVGTLVSGAFVFAVFAFVNSSVLPRYVIVVVPFFWAAVAASVSRLEPKTVGLALTGALVAINVVALYRFYVAPEYRKEDYRSISAIVRGQAGSSRVLLVAPSQPLVYYRVQQWVELSSSAVATSVLLGIPAGKEYWLLVDKVRLERFDPSGSIQRIVKEAGTLRETKTLGWLELYKIQRSDADPGSLPR